MPASKAATKYVRPFAATPAKRDDLEAWLKEVYQYVEGEAEEAIGWYTRNTKNKKRWSRVIRYSAIMLGGLAALFPIVITVWPARFPANLFAPQQTSLFVSLLLGLAALLVAFDRFGDFSSGWMRYILAAFDIRSALQDFRMDWAAYQAQVTGSANPSDAAKCVARAKQFVSSVEKLVGDETRQWAAEFQSNLGQMEKEFTAKWEAREKEVREKREATRPGAIQLNVLNVSATDNRSFIVRIRSSDGSPPLEEAVFGAVTWVKVGLAPGLYTVSAQGIIKNRRSEGSKVIEIKPNEVADVNLELLD